MLFDFPSYSLILPGAGRRHVVDSGGDKVWVSAQFGGWRGLFALGTGGSACRVKMVILGLKQYTVHYTTNLISKDGPTREEQTVHSFREAALMIFVLRNDSILGKLTYSKHPLAVATPRN